MAQRLYMELLSLEEDRAGLLWDSIEKEGESTLCNGNNSYKIGMKALADVMDLRDIAELTDSFAEEALSEISQVCVPRHNCFSDVPCAKRSEQWNRDSKGVTQFCALLCLCSHKTFASVFETTSAIIKPCLADHKRDPELRCLLYQCSFRQLHPLAQIAFPLSDQRASNNWPVGACRHFHSCYCYQRMDFTSSDLESWQNRCLHKVCLLLLATPFEALFCRFAALSLLKTILENRPLTTDAWMECIHHHALLCSLYQSLDEDHFAETRLLALQTLNILIQQIGNLTFTHRPHEAMLFPHRSIP